LAIREYATFTAIYKIVIEDLFMHEFNSISRTAVIEDTVKLGKRNIIGHNVVMRGDIEIGDDNYFADFVSIGGLPKQRLLKEYFSENNKAPKIKIGNKNCFLEHTNIHMPVQSLTQIENRVFLNAHVQIAHDCIIRNNSFIAAGAVLGGYVILQEGSYVGMSSSIHQRCVLGAHSILGMSSALVTHLRPFSKAGGVPARYIKVNEKGIEKHPTLLASIDEIQMYLQDKNFTPNNSQISKLIEDFNTDILCFPNDRQIQ